MKNTALYIKVALGPFWLVPGVSLQCLEPVKNLVLCSIFHWSKLM